MPRSSELAAWAASALSRAGCATALVNFWSELATPEDDTLGKYLIVTLRILKYEGLDRDEAAAWVEERLEALENTSFSDRLTHDFGEIQRVVALAVEAIWDGNGYQKDPALSDIKLQATVDAWGRKGFLLRDPSTWHKHSQAETPANELVWSSSLMALLPDLADLANATNDQAKNFLKTVLCFVEEHNELSESMVGILLKQNGIKGDSRQKQHDVRQFLVTKGLLIKQRNYFNDKSTGYRHGNFYICGLSVEFKKEAQPQGTHTVSIYLSLFDASEVNEAEQSYNIVLERRRSTCERRYQERIRRLRQVIR